MSSNTDEKKVRGYSEGSPFVRLLGKPGRVKLLDVFLRKHYQELTAPEVSDLANVAPSTFHRNIDYLVEIGVIEPTREIGGTQLYKLNIDNQIAKVLGSLRTELLEFTDQITVESKQGAGSRFESDIGNFGSERSEWGVTERLRAKSQAEIAPTAD